MLELCKLISSCTADDEFVFNGIKCKHTDGVDIRRPLTQVLADIFMGYLELKVKDQLSMLTGTLMIYRVCKK